MNMLGDMVSNARTGSCNARRNGVMDKTGLEKKVKSCHGKVSGGGVTLG